MVCLTLFNHVILGCLNFNGTNDHHWDFGGHNFRVHFFSQGTYQLAVDSCGSKRFARPRSKKTNIWPSSGGQTIPIMIQNQSNVHVKWWPPQVSSTGTPITTSHGVLRKCLGMWSFLCCHEACLEHHEQKYLKKIASNILNRFFCWSGSIQRSFKISLEVFWHVALLGSHRAPGPWNAFFTGGPRPALTTVPTLQWSRHPWRHFAEHPADGTSFGLGFVEGGRSFSIQKGNQVSFVKDMPDFIQFRWM